MPGGPSDEVIRASDGLVIDGIVRFAEKNLFVLALLESGEWLTDPAVRADLARRVKACVQFVKSGELATRYPESVDSTVRIDLNCTQDPDEEGWKLIQALRTEVESGGLAFNYRRLPG
ncbi:MAG TPA: DUF6572 domain-containing protein [Planctomycetota bacterium]